ncbi:melanocyte-stimulating hormone receptor-like [Exaiptasia diaphana]|uniref:G-protein coupled receptors family 1 profile domain-containing protein n=1 Tax=Exaiptasia diaphana TaxID=2652724 RepID=A0A913Y8N2_EXADI|nr:melanocyte-stimulating hormone receptor-like [Exaiptasia diaphana]
MNNFTEPPSNGSFERLEKGLAISLISINALSSVVACVLNFLIIATFIKTSSMWTPSYILIVSLAFSDLGVGALVQPVFCVNLFATMKACPSLFDMSSDITQKSGWVLVFSSFLTITAITIDRFLALNLHLRYQELVTTQRSLTAVIFIWILGLSGLLTQWFHIAEIIYPSVVATLVILNITLMVKISRAVSKHSATIHAQEQAVQGSLDLPGYKKTVNTMYYIMGTLAVCYVPVVSEKIISFVIKRSAIAWYLTYTIMLINSALNPVIYFWRIQDMRNALLQLFRTMPCCQQQH